MAFRSENILVTLAVIVATSAFACPFVIVAIFLIL